RFTIYASGREFPKMKMRALEPLSRSSRREEAHFSKSEIRNPKSAIDRSLLTSAAARFRGSGHLQKLDLSWGHERWGETSSSSDLRKTGIKAREDARRTRFMGSLHGFATAHLDHERWGETPSSPDLPATGIS